MWRNQLETGQEVRIGRDVTAGKCDVACRPAKSAMTATTSKMFDEVASVGGFAEANKENALPIAADSAVTEGVSSVVGPNPEP